MAKPNVRTARNNFRNLGNITLFFKVKKKEKLNVIYDGWMKKKLSYIWTTYVDLKFCQSNYEKNISTLEEEKKK